MGYRKFILAILILVIIESNCFELPPQFWKVFISLKGYAGATLRTKIYYGILQVNLLPTSMHSLNEHLECNPRLLHTMACDLKCPRAANDIKPHLDIMEYYFNMTKDEKFLKSFFERNCTNLSVRSAKVCQLILSRGTFLVGYDEFSKIILDCQSENLEQDGDLRELLSERSDSSM